MIKTITLIAINLVIAVQAIAQRNTNYIIDSLNYKHENISLLTFRSGAEPKPTILFLQGSLPIPLIMKFESGDYINLPFNSDSLIKDYHIVCISAPYTPLSATMENLNTSYCFVPDSSKPNTFRDEYTTHNNLNYYRKRTIKVIKTLSKEKWFNGEYHIIGHSQGAKITAVVGSNTKPKSVAFLGFNAFGRFDEMLRRTRKEEDQNKLIDRQTNLYNQWEFICQNEKDINSGAMNWSSFSIDYTSYLSKIKCPIFIGYGTKDIIAENSDLIPLSLIKSKKYDFTVQPYLNQDHNFFDVQNGNIDYSKSNHWNDVISDILDWQHQVLK